MAEEITKIQEFSEIVVDDGSVKVPIRNKFGEELGVFYFRPTDIGILDRYNKLAGAFDAIVAPLENVDIAPDGTPEDTDETQRAAFAEAEKRLYAACDELFGGNYSEAFFGKMKPFSPVGGLFYCERTLEVVGNFISKAFDREVKKINTRVDKYTHGYSARTGKHKDGKQ